MLQTVNIGGQKMGSPYVSAKQAREILCPKYDISWEDFAAALGDFPEYHVDDLHDFFLC